MSWIWFCCMERPIIRINVAETGEKIFLTRNDFLSYKSYHQFLVSKNIVFSSSEYRMYAENQFSNPALKTNTAHMSEVDPYSSFKVHKEIKIRVYNGLFYDDHRTLNMTNLYR